MIKVKSEKFRVQPVKQFVYELISRHPSTLTPSKLNIKEKKTKKKHTHMSRVRQEVQREVTEGSSEVV